MTEELSNEPLIHYNTATEEVQKQSDLTDTVMASPSHVAATGIVMAKPTGSDLDRYHLLCVFSINTK